MIRPVAMPLVEEAALHFENAPIAKGTNLELSVSTLQHLHAQLPDKKQDTRALVIAAVQVLLFRYSASTSEVLDIKIRHKTDDEIKNPIYRNEHQLHLQKAINGKQSFLEILANVRHELEGFLSKFDTNIPFATELKWVTDNDGPQLEYKIAINDVRQVAN